MDKQLVEKATALVMQRIREDLTLTVPGIIPLLRAECLTEKEAEAVINRVVRRIGFANTYIFK